MDTHFSEQDLSFREEVRDFLATAWSEDLKTQLRDRRNLKAGMIAWQKRLYDQGWVAPGWPEEFGGTGWTPTQAFIWDTERSGAGAPDVIPFGLKMVGPVIYSFGNDEQKAKFLPRILQSDDWWCQGYSEPGAGSDLAALKTKAELDGDHYVVNGAKIWTTYAQYSDWIFCLVRTSNEGKRQQGISFLLIDMKSDGITINPIESIDGVHSLNEVVFENVRVPIENRIGEENKGWTYAKALLAHERTAIAGVPESKRRIRELRRIASQQVSNGKALIDEPMFRMRLADVEIDLMALEYTELRVLASSAKGQGPGVESSLLKIKGTEIQQRVQELLMDAAGYHCGYIAQDPLQTVHEFADAARREYMYGRAATIYGGSNEIQKNITAKYVLGL